MAGIQLWKDWKIYEIDRPISVTVTDQSPLRSYPRPNTPIFPFDSERIYFTGR